MRQDMLYEGIVNPDMLRNAFHHVLRNNGASGVDGITVGEFRKREEERLDAIRHDLDTLCYTPDRLLYLTVPKPDGRERMLAVPTVRDRVVLTALAWALDPILDAEFSTSSFAYRPGLSRHDALEHVRQCRDAACRYVTHVDIASFFDDIHRGLLLTLLRRHVRDDAVLSLVEAFLEAPLLRNGVPSYAERGVPQGSPLSPLLSNLYLHELDAALEGDGLLFARYADNVLVLSVTEDDARAAGDAVLIGLHALGLTPNQEKTYVTTFDDGFTFLGARFLGDAITVSGNARAPRASGVGSPRQPTNPGASASSRHDSSPPSEAWSDAEPERDDLPDLKNIRGSRAVDAPLPNAEAPQALYIQRQGATLGCKGRRLYVRKGDDELFAAPIFSVESVFAFGRCLVTPAAMRLCLTNGVGITFLSSQGTHYGSCEPVSDHDPHGQIAQLARAGEVGFQLQTAVPIVRARIDGARRLLMRGKRSDRQMMGADLGAIEEAVSELDAMSRQAAAVTSVEALRGCEGYATRVYYRALEQLLPDGFTFKRRTRRPPTDPVNALLSLGSTLLTNHVYAFIVAEGMNPHIGTLHEIRPGMPGLAADLTEEFRAPVVEALAISLLSRRIIKRTDFTALPDEGGACLLTRNALRVYLDNFSRAMMGRSSLNGVYAGAPGGSGGRGWRAAIHGQVKRYARYVTGREDAYEPLRLR